MSILQKEEEGEEEQIPKIFQNLNPFFTISKHSKSVESQIYLKFMNVNSRLMFESGKSEDIILSLSPSWSIYKLIMNSYYTNFDFTRVTDDELISIMDSPNFEDISKSCSKRYKPCSRRYRASFFGFHVQKNFLDFYGKEYENMEFIFTLILNRSDKINTILYKVQPVESKKQLENRKREFMESL